MRLRSRRLFLLPFACIISSGCIHLAPVSREGDRAEALQFTKLLRSLVHEMTDVLNDEQLFANDLKILLEENTGKEFNSYRGRFDTIIEKLVVIRDRRTQIRSKLLHRSWKGALAQLIQQNALSEINQDIDRTQMWMQLAHNFRLRADYGRLKDYPELSLLSRSLDSFLSETQPEPMSSQISSLRAEYRFKESDLGPN